MRNELPENFAVSKRVYLTLPDTVYEDLERWAKRQGRPAANLGAFLVETAINEAKDTGELPPEPPKVTQGEKRS